MSLNYWCLERKWKSASLFPSWEQPLLYLRLSLMTWLNKTSIKSAASAKRRGFTTSLEAAWESGVILTNWIWHNLDAVLMRTIWNGDAINPLDSQKEKGLNWPSLCGKSDLLTSRDLPQPTSLGSPGQGLGVTGTSGLCCYEEKQSNWALWTNATAKCAEKGAGMVVEKIDSSCRKVRVAFLGAHGKSAWCCQQRVTMGFKRSFARLRGFEQLILPRGHEISTKEGS